ncbi:unnamed protein product [Rhizoctonia solani]|uniref:Nephrocystin 3-like N-terminal domain-containing protein n=1 Tax=Rhizoctonia solani TaxID=456999 RepID=A0A8H3EC00_9AGAM|nr:unnamed protein product [Rhizoctonia solani]
MRSGAKWLKDAVKRPASPLPPSGNPERVEASYVRARDLSGAPNAVSLLPPGLPPSTELEPMIVASGRSTQALGPTSQVFGRSTQISIPDAETFSNNKHKGPENAAWSRLTKSLRALETSVELFPPLKSAVGAFIGCLDIVQKAAQNREDYIMLADELQSMASTLIQYTGELELEPSNGSIANMTQEVSLLIITRWLLFTVNELSTPQRTLLQCVAPIDDARYNSSYSDTIRRRGCTAQTREAIHQGIQDWTINPQAEKIYWMNGMAGTGKTTIAYSYCEWLKSTNRLGASFFCSRISSTCRSLSQIVPTVAYQLAHFSPAFRARLCAVLNNDPVAGKVNVRQQFEALIYKPILAAKDAIPDDVVIVIDALDECDDNYSVRLLLDVLLRFTEELPLKFFVASRPEPMIRDRMMSQGGSSRYIVYLHDIEQSIVKEDIKKYLTEAFAPMESPPTLLQIELLAKRSRNLFIYAATVVRYIYPDDLTVDSSDRLELMLNAISTSKGTFRSRYEDLDFLYTTVLSGLFKSRLENGEKDRMRTVLWTVVCAREPIPASTIALLGTLTERQVMAALQFLRSVVHVPENSSLISPLHASFPEYMLDKSRSKRFHCDELKSNEMLAHRCFEIMKSELRFNICALQSSYLTDDKVQDLGPRVAQCISPNLSYACRYWGSHLQLAPTANGMADMLFDFLSNRLLFWMEVLSLSRCIGIGAPMMQQAQTWLQKAENMQDTTQKQVSDARNFITWFAANPCSQSTPHIYISALAFCARSSWVHQHYSQRTQGLVSLSVNEHEEAVLAIWNVEYEVYSLAISPNGDHIATGGHNGSVQVYDIHTGALVAGPFQAHTAAVNSVAFSPSGVRIATGSGDTTIIVWDTLTGRVIAGPLRQHTRVVHSVAFAPDDKRLVSGSYDHTVIVWDTSTGDISLGPLRGHTSYIWSVCFSPTGQLIASCSSDQLIMLWDAQTGANVAILEGHQSAITGTTFSPDGSRLASCSKDNTIRLWDIATRNPLRQPFTGRGHGIWSIAFSSDNMHIVSGGDGNGNVVMWNTLTGFPVLGPLSGHSQVARCVVFSPDNSRIVSCSRDRTIRIWDTQSKSGVSNQQSTREVAIGPVAFLPNCTQFISKSSNGLLRVWDMLTGKHTPLRFRGQNNRGKVQSLTVSSRGAYVAAGISDGTIQVWDFLTGNAVFQPLEGHEGSIHSLTFSPGGTRLCSGSGDATIIIWDTETGVMIGEPYRGHTSAVASLTYSPDGTFIASGSTDFTVRVWSPLAEINIDTLNGHKASVSSVAFSPSGSHIVSGSLDGVIRTWDIGTGTCMGVLSAQQNEPSTYHSVTFSPDGGQLVSAFGSSIRLVDARTMILISQLGLPSSEQTQWVGYSPDCTDIISVSVTPTQESLTEPNQQSPNIIRVWRDATPDQLASPIAPRSWSYKRDGRISSSKGFVMWIPPDLVSHLEAHTKLGSDLYYSPLSLSPDASIDIGYSNLRIGERWTECYMDKD